MPGIPEVDTYIETTCAEFAIPLVRDLRRIYLDEGLKEELKWGAPCYSHKGLVCSNGSFKKHVASWFFKGALLYDPNKVLRKAQKDTKGLRSLYFEEGNRIDEKQVRNFVKEAMILNEQGIQVKYGKKKSIAPPDYFLEFLSKHVKALASYEIMAPSRQKEYILWITEAKRPDTRHRRLRKMVEMLEEGKGLNDKYRK